MGAQKALFLDRDGVINVDRGYVHTPDQFTFVDGIHALVEAAHARGYRVIIVTNQSGIGRGYYSEAAFVALMEWLKTHLPYDAYYYCPHHPEHGVGNYRQACPDRKPNPGMILKAARDHGIDLAQSLLLGDQETDAVAGKRAGIGTVLLLGDGHNATQADHVIGSLQEALPYLSAQG